MNYRVESLTIFRFVAAAIVVIFHFGREATGFGGILVSGPQMVTFFFVLSGFVMVLSYYAKGNISATSYWWARLSRIMPVYILGIALMVVYFQLENEKINATSLILNILLLQAWFTPHPLSINSPGWSLSVEAFFYFTFPMILGLILKYKISALKIISAAVALWAVTQIILTYLLSSDFYQGAPSTSHDLIYYFPLSHFCSFLLGIAGGLWFVTHDFRIRNNYQSIVVVGIAALLVVLSLNNQSQIADYLGFWPAFGSSFFAPLFLIFIISISICQTKAIEILSAKPLVLLGEASFSLYIFHKPVYLFYIHHVASINLTSQSSFYVCFIFLTAISILSFLILERPAMKFLRITLPKLYIRA